MKHECYIVLYVCSGVVFLLSAFICYMVWTNNKFKINVIKEVKSIKTFLIEEFKKLGKLDFKKPDHKK